MAESKSLKASKSSARTRPSGLRLSLRNRGSSDETSYTSNKVPFGVDLNTFCKQDALHPNLLKLFNYVCKNGPGKLTIPVYSKSTWWESKWLKRSLQKGDVHNPTNYSSAAYVLALRNFLKHLPHGPLLQGKDFIQLADDMQVSPQSQWEWIVPQFKQALQTFRPIDFTLLHQVADMMRTLCFDKTRQAMNQSNLEEVTNLFGPVLMRKKVDEKLTVESKPCPEAVILTRFLILHSTSIFDVEAEGTTAGATETVAKDGTEDEVVDSVEDTTVEHSKPVSPIPSETQSQDFSTSSSATTDMSDVVVPKEEADPFNDNSTLANSISDDDVSGDVDVGAVTAVSQILEEDEDDASDDEDVQRNKQSVTMPGDHQTAT